MHGHRHLIHNLFHRVYQPVDVEGPSLMTRIVAFVRCAMAVSIVAALCVPALAAPTVIAELGSAPLLGPTATLADLQVSVARNEARLSAAAALEGMTAAEYRAFRAEVQTVKPQWVRVPRRLDAMTWFDGYRVRVIHDVEIPAATYGWEYDEAGVGERLRIFMPVACGNLSILRERIRRVAAMLPRVSVAAMPMQAIVSAPVPSRAAPMPSPAATPTTPPPSYFSSPPRRGVFPFLAAFFGFLVIGG